MVAPASPRSASSRRRRWRQQTARRREQLLAGTRARRRTRLLSRSLQSRARPAASRASAASPAAVTRWRVRAGRVPARLPDTAALFHAGPCQFVPCSAVMQRTRLKLTWQTDAHAVQQREPRMAEEERGRALRNEQARKGALIFYSKPGAKDRRQCLVRVDRVGWERVHGVRQSAVCDWLERAPRHAAAANAASALRGQPGARQARRARVKGPPRQLSGAPPPCTRGKYRLWCRGPSPTRPRERRTWWGCRRRWSWCG